MNKLTVFPLVVVLLITITGFYFLYRDKSQLSTDIDLLKQEMESIHQENNKLHLRITALEENSVTGITERAGKTLRKSFDAVIESIDRRIDQARDMATEEDKKAETAQQPESGPAPQPQPQQ